jgi:hypothetical protein
VCVCVFVCGGEIHKMSLGHLVVPDVSSKVRRVQ